MSKNAISLLQEYRQKQAQEFPVYTEISSLTGIHPNKFKCRCKCGEHRVDGEGPSKRDAKLAAAKSMIQLLIKTGEFELKPKVILPDPINIPLANVTEIPSELLVHEKSHSSPSFVNHVGQLQEICVQNKLKIPQYTDESINDGFKCICTIGSHVAVGTAGNKKGAKQNSAEAMINIFIKKYPQLLNTVLEDQIIENVLEKKSGNSSNKTEFNLPIKNIELDLKNLEISEPDENQKQKAKEIYLKYTKNSRSKNSDKQNFEKNTLENFHVLFKESYDKDVLNEFYNYCNSTKLNEQEQKLDQIQKVFDNICKILKLKAEVKHIKTSNDTFMTSYSLNAFPKTINEIGIGINQTGAILNGMSRMIYTLILLLN